MRFLFFALLFNLLSFNSFSFPVIYSCKEGHLESSEKINPNDLFETYVGMNKEEKSEFQKSVCRDSNDCIERLSMIAQFAKINQESAFALFQEELAKLKSAKIPDSLVDLAQDSVQLFKKSKDALACNNAMYRLEPEDYIHNDSLITPYPYHSNYMYVSGCHSINGKGCNPMRKSSVDKVIKESVAMGTDPYVALALALMEGGTSNVGELYLDPIGVMGAIGCGGRQVANNKEGAFYSYGTSYEVNATIKENPDLRNRLKKAVELEKTTSFDGLFKNEHTGARENFFCYDTKDSSTNPVTTATPGSDSCCLRLDFEANAHQISHLLTYEFINKTTKNKFRGKSEPEWMLQRFNGFTDLMGAAEGVPSWRMGVNYYDNPGYGQQTMDYIVNALLFNPYIKKKVEEASGENPSWESILCKHKSDGLYHYDSDKYFNKVKNSKRLEAIEEKFKSGASFDELSKRQKKVMNRELKETSTKNPYMVELLSDLERGAIFDHFIQAMPTVDFIGDMFRGELRNATEQWEDYGKNLDVPKATFFAVAEMIGNQNLLFAKEDEIQELLEKELQALEIQCESLEASEACLKEVESFRYLNYDEEGEVLKADIPGLNTLKLNQIMIQQNDLNVEIENEFKKAENGKIAQLPGMSEEVYFRISEGSRKLLSTDKVIEKLKEHEGYEPAMDKMVAKLHEYYQNLSLPNDKDKAYKHYFKNIYSSRKTLEDTSDYSWKKFSERDVEKLVNKLYSTDS